MNISINFNKQRNVGVICFNKNRLIRKFITKKKNQKLIENEANGLNWYSIQKKNLKEKYILNKNKNYIDLRLIEGKQVKYWDTLEKNIEYAKKVIAHYIQVWPSRKITPCHGDLTFSNIIFKTNCVPHIIDWENFLIKKSSWGYDLAYFLISTVALPNIYFKKKKINKNDLYLLNNLWNKIFINKDFDYLIDPITYFKKNYRKTFILRTFKNYYPNLLSKNQINQIYEALKK